MPEEPYHKLAKDYLAETTGLPDAVFDAQACAALLGKLLTRWDELGKGTKIILKTLLGSVPAFQGFFEHFASEVAAMDDPLALLRQFFRTRACINAPITSWLRADPSTLAFVVMIVRQADGHVYSPSWVLSTFPRIWEYLQALRTTPCARLDCPWCTEKLDPHNGLSRFFQYPAFRTFEGDQAGEPSLQEKAVRAAIAGESLLTIFPTGGGKSLTFQLPALMIGQFAGALTVVVSPLVALMKDQVDGLLRRSIVQSATLNSLLNDIERRDVVDKVARGVVHILYLSPESLRSNTVMRLLVSRHIARFVIDEAHCFSAWGQDFRVDYQYIGTFIQDLQEQKGLSSPIPISCFTATARPEVIEDIAAYFRQKLGLELTRYTTEQKRHNLYYEAVPAAEGEARNAQVYELLQTRTGPAIVYVVRVKHAERVAEYLQKRHLPALFYHGQMEAEEKKLALDQFRDNADAVMVATSAFGMGVDKDNVRMVIHYTISNSLENYLQEAGRGGRNPQLDARCIVLYGKEDLDKHFTLLKQSKISKTDIDKIWDGIKKFRTERLVKSPLELAKAAGWDLEMDDLETKVKAAIHALEMARYVDRKHNSPLIMPSARGPRNLLGAHDILAQHTGRFTPSQYSQAERILQFIYGKDQVRIDYMADALGMSSEEIQHVLGIFNSIGILLHGLDITVELKNIRGARAMDKLAGDAMDLERALLRHYIDARVGQHHALDCLGLNEKFEQEGIPSTIDAIQQLLRMWEWNGKIRRKRIGANHMYFQISFRMAPREWEAEMLSQHGLAKAVVKALPVLRDAEHAGKNSIPDRNVFDLATHRLKGKVEEDMFRDKLGIANYHQALLYLHNVGAIQLREGFLIYKSRLILERLYTDNNKKFVKEDYATLEKHYKQRQEQIHIVGEYVSRLLNNKVAAEGFVGDYFAMGHVAFVDKYFPDRKVELARSMTAEKFEQIFLGLSPEQSAVIQDSASTNILVAAGPGSGKTRVLVRKMAALVTLEDHRAEQFLMLAFSRAAVNEFRSRMRELLPASAKRMDFLTFHGFAFQLIGQHGNLEKSGDVISQAISAIENAEMPTDRVAGRTVIMVDEFQDISEVEWRFLSLILDKAAGCKLIVVGDDDQAILGFRGGSAQYMRSVAARDQAASYYLTTNYRSAQRIVDLSNQLLALFPATGERIKAAQPLTPRADAPAGMARLHHYQGGKLLPAMLEVFVTHRLAQPLARVAILCKTNEEVMQVVVQLNRAGIKAQALQAMSGFQLRHLAELVNFSEMLSIAVQADRIDPGLWEVTVQTLMRRFADSADLKLAVDICEAFLASRPDKLLFLSEWEAFLLSLDFSDLLKEDLEAVFVTTIHKAKGREFEQVHMVWPDAAAPKEADWNVMYVGMTRAKMELHIHTCNPVFDRLYWQASEVLVHPGRVESFREIEFQCGLKDIFLSRFQSNEVNKACKG
jgi:ATP-dependent DNA helicase RecQ